MSLCLPLNIYHNTLPVVPFKNLPVSVLSFLHRISPGVLPYWLFGLNLVMILLVVKKDYEFSYLHLKQQPASPKQLINTGDYNLHATKICSIFMAKEFLETSRNSSVFFSSLTDVRTFLSHFSLLEKL